MASRYWVGGTADWDTTAGSKWALTSGGAGGQAVPTAADNVFFDANSGSVTCTITGSQTCLNLDCTGFIGTFTGTSTPVLTISGNMVLSGGMIGASTPTYVFNSTTTGNTLNTFGRILGSITFNGVGGEWSLLDAITLLSASTLNVASGNFNANNFNVTTGRFASNSGSTRTVTMGSGLWTLLGVSAVWDVISTGLTFNKNTANITLTSTAASSRTFTGGGLTYNNLNIGGSTGVSSTQIIDSNTFGTISSTKTVAYTIRFTSGTTTTVANWTAVGSAGNIITIASSTAATHTLTKTGGGTILTDYMSISNSTATPASTWYATNSTDGGGNSGWTFGSVPSPNFFFMFL